MKKLILVILCCVLAACGSVVNAGEKTETASGKIVFVQYFYDSKQVEITFNTDDGRNIYLCVRNEDDKKTVAALNGGRATITWNPNQMYPCYHLMSIAP